MNTSIGSPTRVGFQYQLAYGDRVSRSPAAQGPSTELHGDGEFEPNVLELFRRLDDTVEPLTGLSDPRVKRLVEGLVQGTGNECPLPSGFEDRGGADPQGRASISALLHPVFSIDQGVSATETGPGVVSVQLTTYAAEQQPEVPGLFRASQLLQGEFRNGVLEPESIREHLDLGYLIAGSGK